MQQIVINRCYGGFSLSRKAFLRLRKLGQKNALNEADWGEPWGDGSEIREPFGFRGEAGMFCRDIPRNASLLIQVVKELGVDANGAYAELKIAEIPDGVRWVIEEYDGIEWIAEKHKKPRVF